jgi:hypothetical protein
VAEALRDNKGKDELSYILDIPEALKALSHVFRQGAKKYSRGNWQLGGKPDAEYLDACMRHLTKHVKEGPFDPETGALHLAHAIWNLAALIELNIEPRVGVFNTTNTMDGTAPTLEVERRFPEGFLPGTSIPADYYAGSRVDL